MQPFDGESAALMRKEVTPVHTLLAGPMLDSLTAWIILVVLGLILFFGILFGGKDSLRSQH
jgi:hypothetical protein